VPGWIELRALVLPEAVRVEVVDPGPGFRPQVPRPTLDQTSGRGLFLVENVADRWGMYNDGTTSVWFELDLPPSS
jgi:anti-sigma regulatory factor (Ser/Thr protein kinase)